MPRRSCTAGPALLAAGASLIWLCLSTALASPAHATAAPTKLPQTGLGGFVKDPALAQVLGETLFHDTMHVLSGSSAASRGAPSQAGAADPTRDNSAAGQVARAVLAQKSLDKYLWLIRRAYNDSLWRGGDRARIEQHFPLIWRTSIMLYEATLNATPHRVRVCTPADDGESFDCRDELERAKIVPIPSPPRHIDLLHQPVIG